MPRPCAVVAFLLALPVLTAGAQQVAVPAPCKSAATAPAPQCEHFSDRQHVLGLLADFGGGAFNPGLRYYHAHRSGEDCSPHGGLSWIAYGAEVRLLDGEALAGYGSARIGASGGIGAAFELGLGPASDFDTTRLGTYAGLFLSSYYMDLGASYQFPIGADRPHWLASWHFAVRFHIPLATNMTAKTVTPVEW